MPGYGAIVSALILLVIEATVPTVPSSRQGDPWLSIEARGPGGVRVNISEGVPFSVTLPKGAAVRTEALAPFAIRIPQMTWPTLSELHEVRVRYLNESRQRVRRVAPNLYLLVEGEADGRVAVFSLKTALGHDSTGQLSSLRSDAVVSEAAIAASVQQIADSATLLGRVRPFAGIAVYIEGEGRRMYLLRLSPGSR